MQSLGVPKPSELGGSRCVLLTTPQSQTLTLMGAAQGLEAFGGPPGILEDAACSHLVVHDGTETHDADVDVVLLADNAGIPQRLPAV